MRLLRNSKATKVIALFLAISLLNSLVFPTAVLALTSGPGQPEFQSFTPVGTSNMVNNFTGDFNYNLPLMDVGGYPINIAYTAGSGMDDEATWVGLGWNLNPGSMQRSMRGVPDDFAGDRIVKEVNMKPMNSFELDFTRTNYEVFGLDIKTKQDFGFALSYNNYSGYGFKMKGDYGGLSISSSSSDGFGMDYQFPVNLYKKEVKDEGKFPSTIYTHSLSVGLSYNSRSGLNNLTLGYDKTTKELYKVAVDQSSAEYYDKTKNYGSFNYSFLATAYTPNIPYPKFNISGNLSMNFGMEAVGNFWASTWTGSFYSEYLRKNADKLNIPAYGYMNASKARFSKDAMHDFSREKDVPYATYVPHLPLSSVNFDVYSYTAQGTSGNFRAKNSAINVIFDYENNNLGGGLGLGGIDFGASADVKFGINLNVSQNNATSGVWDDNDAYNDFTRTPSGDPFYEDSYFKTPGEFVPEINTTFYDDFGDDKAAKVVLQNHLFWADTKNEIYYEGTKKTIPLNYRSFRERRNQNINYLNGYDAKKYGFFKSIQNYAGASINTSSGAIENITEIDRLRYPGHHISEFYVTQSDGARYYYSIPAYNLKQVESSFSINGQTGHYKDVSGCATGHAPCEFQAIDPDSRFTTYSSGDDSKNNENGIDHFYEKVLTPAYAYSYLLTAVVSADYIDLTGNGPTDDDYGTYVKFNYQKLTQKYGWRAPFWGANYQSGLRSSSGEYGDDRGSYTYGEKEIWYLHSIETKTHIAEFQLSDRDDGLGAVQNAYSCMHEKVATNLANFVKLKKLDQIKLFAKSDRLTNPNARPLKVVKFYYDYTLCKRVLNNYKAYSCNSSEIEGSGKLTLRKVEITNESSLLGQLSAYTFNYCEKKDGSGAFVYDSDLNPDYCLNATDRWGTYKAPTSSSSNSVFPYSLQTNRTLTDKYASAWNLTTIGLPSGSQIHVQYEADDYSYVQNKRVMSMMKVKGYGYDAPPESYDATYFSKISNYLYNDPHYLLSANRINRYMFFEIPSHISTKSDLVNLCLKDENYNYINSIYFKFLINIKSGVDEYVPGYLRNGIHYDFSNSNNYGIFPTPGANWGWIRIECAPLRDISIFDCSTMVPNLGQMGGCNPVSQVAWNYIKSNLPTVAYDQPDPTGPQDVFEIFKGIFSALKQLSNSFSSFNARMRSEEKAETFVADKSIIRLYSGYSKVGGGYRVKQITYNDTWAGESTPHEYGQDYSYTTFDKSLNKEVSSGVASYEPLIGGEENPYRQPIFTVERHFLSPNEEHLMELPLGESFFPSATVGYSKVTVKNINYSTSGLTTNNVGKQEFGFYTAKDYPVIVHTTDKEAIINKIPVALRWFKVPQIDKVTASEGYSVISNDMHGKAYYENIYSYKDEVNPITSRYYYYKTNGGYDANRTNELNNNVKLIGKDGVIRDGRIGVEYDITSDFRKKEEQSRSIATEINTDVLTSLLTFIPSLFLKFSYSEKVFKSVVLTKSIQKVGIMDSVVVKDLSSTVTTSNMLYDEESGEVLLTHVVNQFNDPLYNFKYPAYWAYENLGSKYWNERIALDISTALTNPSAYFHEGDKVVLVSQVGEDVGWVTRLNPLTIGDIEGQAIYPQDYSSIRVLESGNKNEKDLEVGSILSKVNPVSGNQLVFDKVIQATAVEYSDKWSTFCNCGLEPGKAFNPFIQGTKGIWRPYKTYAFLGGRTQTRVNKNLNVRNDGSIIGFASFWGHKSGKLTPLYPVDWVLSDEILNHLPNGEQIESRNALGIYSSAVFGYGHKVPVIIGVNAKYREIGFESFEDYYLPGCKDRHFTFETVVTPESANAAIQNSKYHSGKSALKINGSQSVILNKIIQNCR